MLRREHHVSRAEERVGPRGENARSSSWPIRSPDAPATAKSTSAPSLRPIQFRCSSLIRFRPVEAFEFVDQALGKGGDAQHPLPHRPAHDRETADFAFAIDHFFVRQHGAESGHQFTGTSAT